MQIRCFKGQMAVTHPSPPLPYPSTLQESSCKLVSSLLSARQADYSPIRDWKFSLSSQAPQGRMTPTPGMTYKEAIVFIVGGGNYLEAESLTTWASKATPVKKITYGATELLNGEAFARQLAELGRMSSWDSDETYVVQVCTDFEHCLPSFNQLPLEPTADTVWKSWTSCTPFCTAEVKIIAWKI